MIHRNLSAFPTLFLMASKDDFLLNSQNTHLWILETLLCSKVQELIFQWKLETQLFSGQWTIYNSKNRKIKEAFKVLMQPIGSLRKWRSFQPGNLCHLSAFCHYPDKETGAEGLQGIKNLISFMQNWVCDIIHGNNRYSTINIHDGCVGGKETRPFRKGFSC